MIINHDFSNSLATRASNSALSDKDNDQKLIIGSELGCVTALLGAGSNAAIKLSAATFMSLNSSEFRDMLPSVIYSPLVTAKFDAVDFAQKLQELKFTGQYKVVAPKIPNLSIITKDLADVAPMVDFAIIDENALISNGPVLCVLSR